MKKSIAGIALMTLALGLSPAMAEETGAGCGIGKIVLEGKSGRDKHLIAAVLNDIIFPRTYSMTTAAILDEPFLGCDPTQTVMRDEERDSFLASNIDSLSQEAAQGHGTHLAALADIIGIDQADQDSFFGLTQQHYDSIFVASEQSPQQLMASLNAAMAQHPTLSRYSR